MLDLCLMFSYVWHLYVACAKPGDACVCWCKVNFTCSQLNDGSSISLAPCKSSPSVDVFIWTGSFYLQSKVVRAKERLEEELGVSAEAQQEFLQQYQQKQQEQRQAEAAAKQEESSKQE